MLQRIQTVYLLLVAILAVITIFMPLAVLQSGDQFYEFDVVGVSTMFGEPELMYATWGLFALTAIIALLALITIFLYKNRMLQIRLSIFNALVMVGFYAVFVYFVYDVKSQIEVTAFSVKLALSFPLIALILDYLAIRNIGADEVLVRSLNRLR
jgi:hypothetical protein